MKLFKFFFIIIFFLSFGNAQSSNKLDEELHLAVTIYKYKDTHVKKMKSLLRRTAIEMEKYFNIKIHVSYIDNMEDEINSFINFKKSNLVLISSSTYLENKELLKKYSKNPFFMTGDDSTIQYYLVASKKSNIKTLKDIRNKKFITFNGYENYNIWLDFLTLKELSTPYEELILSTKAVYSTKRLLLDVYFDKYDFTVVTKKVYNDMILLNPSLEKKLIIIKKSKPIFIYALGLVHKKTPQPIVDKINRIIEDENFRKKLKHLLSLVDRGRIKRLEFEDLKGLESFWAEYKKLKNKYK